MSNAQTIATGTSARIWAENVVDADGIFKVWAVITPPDLTSSPDKPVTDLPILEMPCSSDRYQGSYTGFTAPGTYNVAVFAEDTEGYRSLPSQTSVVVTSSLPPCPVCGGERVTIDSEFGSDTRYECTATHSITLKDGARIKQGATMIFKIEQ